MQVIPPTLGGSSEPLLFWLLLDESDAEICCCSAQSVSPRVCVCVFRILNSKGWGLIMKPDSSSPASICLTVPPIFPSIPSLPVFFFFFLSVSNLPLFLPGSDPPPCSLPGPRLSCSFSLSLSLSLSGPPAFQGHVRGVEEHVGVILVVIAEVHQVGLWVAYCPGVILSDASPVAQPWLQGQLEEETHTHTQLAIYKHYSTWIF